MTDCIFCKIANKKAPAHIVYEDEEFIGFLDARPLNPGHTLVVPKKHYRWVWDLPEEGIRNYFTACKKVVNGIRKSMKTDFVASVILGTEVYHAHVWLIPRFDNDGHGGHIDFNNIKEISKEEIKETAEKIKSAIDTS
jgi:histidine triad (HIT) family protein